jgi:acetate---CoA ligase (ADP-forming) subunit beta
VSTLSEHESKELLAEYDVPVAPERIVATPDEAVAAAGELGMPAVVKLSGAGVAHKTERGLVRLGLDSEAAVHAAATELLVAARADDGDVGLLVAPMVQGMREFIAGVHTDPQFGACVMLGFGGVLAEAVADVVFRLVPIDDVDAFEMLDELRGQRLLDGVRGEPPVDRAALAGVLCGLSRCAVSRADVVAIDVNPLIIADGRPIAVDALIELADTRAASR